VLASRNNASLLLAAINNYDGDKDQVCRQHSSNDKAQLIVKFQQHKAPSSSSLNQQRFVSSIQTNANLRAWFFPKESGSPGSYPGRGSLSARDHKGLKGAAVVNERGGDPCKTNTAAAALLPLCSQLPCLCEIRPTDLEECCCRYTTLMLLQRKSNLFVEP
jgi:hypothetical protein